MTNVSECKDFYNEKIKVGDEVISITTDINVKGYITAIEYDENNNSFHINVFDESRNILVRSANPKLYTTQKRYNDIKNSPYKLVFYDEYFNPICYLPLNNANMEYEIPEDTSVVKIDTPSYSFCLKYSGNSELHWNHENGYYYLLSSDKINILPVGNGYLIFDNEEELRKYIKRITEYFNKSVSVSKSKKLVHRI